MFCTVKKIREGCAEEKQSVDKSLWRNGFEEITFPSFPQI
jgi:hypothetical protein